MLGPVLRWLRVLFCREVPSSDGSREKSHTH